jgi:hypothetical protein
MRKLSNKICFADTCFTEQTLLTAAAELFVVSSLLGYKQT